MRKIRGPINAKSRVTDSRLHFRIDNFFLGISKPLKQRKKTKYNNNIPGLGLVRPPTPPRDISFLGLHHTNVEDYFIAVSKI